jgi:hypothetical protein
MASSSGVPALLVVAILIFGANAHALEVELQHRGVLPTHLRAMRVSQPSELPYLSQELLVHPGVQVQARCGRQGGRERDAASEERGLSSGVPDGGGESAGV